MKKYRLTMVTTMDADHLDTIKAAVAKLRFKKAVDVDTMIREYPTHYPVVVEETEAPEYLTVTRLTIVET